jgi:hypothetical protein
MIALACGLAILSTMVGSGVFNGRVAAVVVFLAATVWPAHARVTALSGLFAQAALPTTAHAKARHSAHPAVKQPAAAAKPATKPVAPDRTGAVTRKKPPRRGKAAVTAIPSAYAAMPQADRLAIQSALAWTGDYTGPPGGEFDQHTIEALKAFQKRIAGKETGVLDDQQRDRLVAASTPAKSAVGWRVIDDPASGARLGVPEKLVSAGGVLRTGSRWVSGRGQIQIETFRFREAGLPALFDQEKKTARRQVEWSALKPDSFVITGLQGLKYFVVRAEASGAEVRGITILYDQATEGLMRPVAIAMANSFDGFPDPHAAPPPGSTRAIEYSTAIAADGRGDLIANRLATSGCDILMVPGYGHADRVAEDASSDLALIRVYGARNLVPGSLGSAGAATGDVTLVGIADPLAQEGHDGVTKVAARLQGGGIEPVPALGFAGAAAIDAQGQFAGTVELKAPVVAGIGPAVVQAGLVPAEAVRAFLKAHGIAPASGHVAMDRSVLRVICVRK